VSWERKAETWLTMLVWDTTHGLCVG
jgi:hypothetical protein